MNSNAACQNVKKNTVSPFIHSLFESNRLRFFSAASTVRRRGNTQKNKCFSHLLYLLSWTMQKNTKNSAKLSNRNILSLLSLIYFFVIYSSLLNLNYELLLFSGRTMAKPKKSKVIFIHLFGFLCQMSFSSSSTLLIVTILSFSSLSVCFFSVFFFVVFWMLIRGLWWWWCLIA